MKLCRVIAMLPCLLVAAGAAADIYSWRDAEGHLHYSDSAPAGNVDVQKRRARSATEAAAAPTTAAGATKPRTLAEKDQEFRKRRTEATDADTKAAKEKADAAQRQEDCRNLRGNLAALEGGQRISRINEKGETEIIDDSRRHSDTERTRRQIEQTCK